MNKCKVVSKLGISQLIIKSQKGQQLSEREVYSINNNEVSGLLHLDVVSKGASFKLVYNITGFVTFKEYLKKALNKETFARILKNILENLKATQETFINQQMLLLDFEHVLVNPATEHIYFTCVPIQGIETGTPLRDFLLNIIQYSTFVPGEDNSYIREYITILNSGINFSVFELEEYINKLTGKESQIEGQTKECPGCHQMVKRGTNYCPYCGTKVTGTTGNVGKKIYDPLSGDISDEPSDSSGNSNHPKPNTNTQGLSSGTTVLGADPGGTTVLGSEELDAPVYPYLIRNKNEEKIPVDKPVFRIGKEKQYSDYFVSDNNAVSRSHADIITRNGRYYIKDLNSTNKTYVDGKAIPIEKEVEIFSRTKLRLANEDFVFYID